MADRFLQCLIDTLAAVDEAGEKKLKGFGPKRMAEAQDLYERYKLVNQRQGQPEMEAGAAAMNQVVDEINNRIEAKARATLKNLAVVADATQRAKQAMTARGGGRKTGHKIVRAAKSFFEDQINVVGPNIESMYKGVFKGRYVNAFENVLDNWSKGAFGRQLGKAHEPNVIRELDGVHTGSKAAKEIADAFRRMKLMVFRDFNHFGGALPALKGADLLPDTIGTVKVNRAGEVEFTEDLSKEINWDTQVWPDGRRIEPEEQEEFLRTVFEYRRSDGASEIRPGLGGGQGANVANMLNLNALLRFKSADSWFRIHQKYGDGNVFDVMMRSLDQMAWKTATVSVLGSNPVAMVKTINAIVRKQAADAGRVKGASKFDQRAVADVDDQMHVVDNMANVSLRTNALDPNSNMATVVGVSSNLASAAMLKQAVFSAIGGDLATTLVTRWANHQPMVTFFSDYLYGLAQQRKSQEWLIQMAIMVDDMTTANFASTRLGLGPTYGYQISRRISDVTMRATGMARVTNALRYANAKEMAATLHRQRGTKFADLKNRAMFERAGITASDWDRVRTEAPEYSPRGNAGKFLRPVDVFDLKHADAPELAAKFMSMMYNEGRNMVLATSLEASARLRLGTRPNSSTGALVHSASMYAGYPLSYLMTYSRLFSAMDTNFRKGQLVAGLLLGAMMTGMVSAQLRQLIAGKEFLPLDDPRTWFKAAMFGGAFSMAGDYISAATQPDAVSSMARQAVGPVFNAAGEVFALAVQEPLIWAGITERAGEFSTSEYAGDWAKVVQQYVLPQTWYLSQIIERDFMSLFETPAQTRRKTKRAQDQGAPYRKGWEPDQGIFTGQ